MVNEFMDGQTNFMIDKDGKFLPSFEIHLLDNTSFGKFDDLEII